MKIKPRPKPKAPVSKVRPRPKPKYDFEGLCNRLQADDAAAKMEVIAKLGLSGYVTDNDLLTAIGRNTHLDMYVSMASGGRFVATCRKQAGSGYEACLQPLKYSISSSPSLITAATIAYVNLCKQFGAFQ